MFQSWILNSLKTSYQTILFYFRPRKLLTTAYLATPPSMPHLQVTAMPQPSFSSLAVVTPVVGANSLLSLQPLPVEIPQIAPTWPRNPWVDYHPRRPPLPGLICGEDLEQGVADLSSVAELVSGPLQDLTWWILSREQLLNFSLSCQETCLVKTCKNMLWKNSKNAKQYHFWRYKKSKEILFSIKNENEMRHFSSL